MQYLCRPVDRRALLRFAGATALTWPLAPAAARAALPKPAPRDDDSAFLAFLAAAESVASDLYRRAARSSWFGDGERRRLRGAQEAKRDAVRRVTGPLGDDAPKAGDFAARFPAADLGSRERMLALAERLERLICRTQIAGVAFASDSATRLLLGRLLVADTQALSTVRALAGLPPQTGLLPPIDLREAGEELDRFLVAPTAPGERAGS